MIESTLLSCTDLDGCRSSSIFIAAAGRPGQLFHRPRQRCRRLPRQHPGVPGVSRANTVRTATPTVLPNGYIYDPTTRQGEYFAFENEELDGGTAGWFLRLSGGGLAGGYPAVNQPRIYLLDESRYDLSSGSIELRRDGDCRPPRWLVVDGVTDFQVAILLAGRRHGDRLDRQRRLDADSDGSSCRSPAGEDPRSRPSRGR